MQTTDRPLISKMPNRFSLRRFSADQWVATLGGCVPVAVVLGVVPIEGFIILTGLVWSISKCRKAAAWRENLSQNPLFWPLICWLAAVVLSRAVNGGSAFQFAHDAAFIRYPLFVIALLDVSSRIPVRRYLMAGLIVGIVYAMLNMASAYTIGHDFLGKPLLRYALRLKEGARIGAVCAYAAPMFLQWGLFDRQLVKRQRVWIFVIGGIAILLLVGCQVRTALMAALLGLVGGSFCQLYLRGRLKIFHVLAMALFACIGVLGILKLHSNFNSIYDRVYIWQVSLQVWLQDPIFGVGISSFNTAYHQVAASALVRPFVSPAGQVLQNMDPRHAHNIFLQLAACTGIVGIAAFGWLYLRATKTILRSRSAYDTGLLSWPLVCIVIGLTGWNIYDPFYTAVLSYFLANIGVCAGASPQGHCNDNTDNPSLAGMQQEA